MKKRKKTQVDLIPANMYKNHLIELMIFSFKLNFETYSTKCDFLSHT